MKKRYSCFVLCLFFSMVTMGISLNVFAEGMPEPPPGMPPGGGMPVSTTSVSTTEGDWTFKIVTSGDDISSTITSYAGKTNHTIIVPSVLGGAKVTTIASQAFGHHNEIAAVYVPDTVEKVEEWAFYDLNRATSISFANPKVEIKDGAFMSSGNAVLYLPIGTMLKSAGGKNVVTNSTEFVSVAIENEKKAKIAGGTYLNIGTAGKENQITINDVAAIANGAFTQRTNQENGAATITFSGDDYTVTEQKIVIADAFQHIVSSDSLNKTFRVLTKEDANKLNQAIASSSSYSGVKSLFNFVEGYYVNGNKVTLDKDVVAYDVFTGAELYGPNNTTATLQNANPNLYYQYVTYKDKDNDGDIDAIYYSPYRISYTYGTVNIASENPNLNGLSARTSLNPAYLSFANAILKAKGSGDDQVYQKLEANRQEHLHISIYRCS